MLPAGTLPGTCCRLRRADVVVINGATKDVEMILSRFLSADQPWPFPCFNCQQRIERVVRFSEWQDEGLESKKRSLPPVCLSRGRDRKS